MQGPIPPQDRHHAPAAILGKGRALTFHPHGSGRGRKVFSSSNMFLRLPAQG